MQKLINFDDVTREDIKSNFNCLQIPNHPCRILISGDCGSRLWVCGSLSNLITKFIYMLKILMN